MWKREYKVFYIIIIALVIVIFLGLLSWKLYAFNIETKLDKVETDWKMLVAAMSAQAMDNCGCYYPADTFEHRQTETNLPLTFECSYSYTTMRQFEDRKLGNQGRWSNGWHPLTTPFAYLKAIPEDPFNQGKYYGYTTWLLYGPDRTLYYPDAILYSPGPDRRENIPLIKLRTIIDNHFKVYGFPTQMFSDADFKFLSETITPILYDPTNGINSSGDLIWVLNGMPPTLYGWRRDQDPRWKIATISADTEALTRHSFDTTVKINSARENIRVPKSLYTIARAVGAFSEEHPSELIDGNLDGVRNSFGRTYYFFFIHPRLLTEEEKAAFDVWKKTSPDWWKAIDSFSPLDLNYEIRRPYPLNSQVLYPFMPLFGKSQILLAAVEWGQGKKDQALRRVRDLRNLLNNIYFPTSEERIRKELNRLAIELEYKILGLNPP
jgi:hypothetical protein